jgi:hypothetical protein
MNFKMLMTLSLMGYSAIAAAQTSKIDLNNIKGQGYAATVSTYRQGSEEIIELVKSYPLKENVSISIVTVDDAKERHKKDSRPEGDVLKFYGEDGKSYAFLVVDANDKVDWKQSNILAKTFKEKYSSK